MTPNCCNISSLSNSSQTAATFLILSFLFWLAQGANLLRTRISLGQHFLQKCDQRLPITEVLYFTADHVLHLTAPLRLPAVNR